MEYHFFSFISISVMVETRLFYCCGKTKKKKEMMDINIATPYSHKKQEKYFKFKQILKKILVNLIDFLRRFLEIKADIPVFHESLCLREQKSSKINM